MENPMSVGTLPAAPAPPAAKPKNITDAAAQFEAMLLQQMLRSTRESMASESGDSGGGTMRDYAEQNLSQMLAQNGGLGIGSMIARGLQQHQAATASGAITARGAIRVSGASKESVTMGQNGN